VPITKSIIGDGIHFETAKPKGGNAIHPLINEYSVIDDDVEVLVAKDM
jgi:hypothetical protein